MSELLNKADLFAAEKHFGQVDKAGKPYIEHPRAVAAMLKNETGKIVALLHDIVEDTDVSIDVIRDEFGAEVAESVALLTHDKTVPYMEYIKAIKANRIARMVKMADLIHNMDLTRLPVVTEKDLERVEKYRKAFDILDGE